MTMKPKIDTQFTFQTIEADDLSVPEVQDETSTAVEVSTPGTGYAHLLARVQQAEKAQADAEKEVRDAALKEAKATIAPYLAEIPSLVTQIEQYRSHYTPL